MVEKLKQLELELEGFDLEIDKTGDENQENSDELCPVCGSVLFKAGRCSTCYSCGWSKCAL